MPNDSPEFRRDPVTGRWVIVAPERSLRPIALDGSEARHRHDGDRRPCPFCPGQEHDTPHELLADRDPGSKPDGPGWRLRVVPNKYPAVRTDPSPTPPPKGEGLSPPSLLGKGAGGLGSSPFQSAPGFGRHEVVIECPEHVADPTRLTDRQFRAVLLAYRDRLLALAADPALRYATVFKNVGAEAGASLGHTHSQILATPIVPEAIRQELDGAADYHARTGRCVFCDMLAHDLADRSRLIAETPHFAAVAPFAGRFAYEMCILPKAHSSRYESLTEADAAELAGLLNRVLRSLDTVLAEPAYNWFLHTAPLREAETPHFHWHVEILPRTSRPAGFEWGAGCFINPVTPEAAAAELRNAIRE